MYIEGKVSIIVPVYNAENFLNRTVDSILAQTYENWELLLADDCSTDQSRDIMSSYTDERIHCFYCEKNSGPAGARNLALHHATGQYIAFLDADDFWLPQKLEKQISFMKI
jgi:teichuronic acid biosynthesis glycosyltransferase TuaG